MDSDKMITITKVVSKNLFIDWWSGVQNTFGANLSSYERMVQKGIQQIRTDIVTQNIHLKWFRFETTQLTNGAVMIMMYGEKK